MITIEESDNIAHAFENFAPDSNGAFPTGRLLSGQYHQENCEEWAERGLHKADGAPVKVYYFFDRTEDGIDGDPETYPWDAAHISKIEIAEKGDDGEWDDL